MVLMNSPAVLKYEVLYLCSEKKMYRIQESNRNLWFQYYQQIQQNLKGSKGMLLLILYIDSVSFLLLSIF